jgi:alcohol dehydrogenase (cytochrome c)
VINGANDVFALDVDTGAILWTYRVTRAEGRSADGPLEPRRRSRRRQGDSSRSSTRKIVALDQKTGKVAWATERGVAERCERNERTALLRRARDRRLLGGEMASRGRVKRVQTRRTASRWQFNTVPGPASSGTRRGRADNNAWQFGGAPVWQTPAVDPDLGLIYFSTGNPGP